MLKVRRKYLTFLILPDLGNKGPFPSPWTYSAHHVNAYEESPSEIVLDMAPTPFQNLRDYLKLDNMLNPPGR